MSAVMPVRHHNRVVAHKPLHASKERALKRTARSFDNAAMAVHWIVWKAQHLGGKR